MILLPVSLASAGASGLIALWLALRVSAARRTARVWVGDGGNEAVIRRMRAQANFGEYAPFVLALLALVELATGGGLWLWAAAAAFVIGRLLHPFGMDGWMPGRGIGTGLTWLVLLGLAIAAVTLAWGQQPRAAAPPAQQIGAG